MIHVTQQAGMVSCTENTIIWLFKLLGWSFAEKAISACRLPVYARRLGYPLIYVALVWNCVGVQH